MKKSNMLIAVLAVMTAAAAVAKAEDIGLDFDGSTIINRPLSLDGVNRVLPAFDAAPSPAAPVSAVDSGIMFYKLGDTKREILRSTISEANLLSLVLDRDVFLLIKDKNIHIIYNTERVFFISSIGENKYKTISETNNRRLIDYLSGLKNPGISQTKQAQVICELVAAYAMHRYWDELKKVYTQVWEETGKLIKVCHTEAGPAQYPTTGGPDCSQGPQRMSL